MQEKSERSRLRTAALGFLTLFPYNYINFRCQDEEIIIFITAGCRIIFIG